MRKTLVVLMVAVLIFALGGTAEAGTGTIVVGYNAGAMKVEYVSGFSGVYVARMAPVPGDIRDCVLIGWRTCPYPFRLKVENAAIWRSYIPGAGQGWVKVLVSKRYVGHIIVRAY